MSSLNSFEALSLPPTTPATPIANPLHHAIPPSCLYIALVQGELPHGLLLVFSRKRIKKKRKLQKTEGKIRHVVGKEQFLISFKSFFSGEY